MWFGYVVNEGLKIIDWYEKFDFDYFEEFMCVIEEIIVCLQKNIKKSLFVFIVCL